jgi:hypothetical protein
MGSSLGRGMQVAISTWTRMAMVTLSTIIFIILRLIIIIFSSTF